VSELHSLLPLLKLTPNRLEHLSEPSVVVRDKAWMEPTVWTGFQVPHAGWLWPCSKHKARLKNLTKDKHPSLFVQSISDETMFIR
jgi:hypothetical protein